MKSTIEVLNKIALKLKAMQFADLTSSSNVLCEIQRHDKGRI